MRQGPPTYALILLGPIIAKDESWYLSIINLCSLAYLHAYSKTYRNVPLRTRVSRSPFVAVNSKRTFSRNACLQASLDDSGDYDEGVAEDSGEYGPVDTSAYLEELIRKRRKGASTVKMMTAKEILRAREKEIRMKEQRQKEAQIRMAQEKEAQERIKQLMEYAKRLREAHLKFDSRLTSIASVTADLQSEFNAVAIPIQRAKDIDRISSEAASLVSELENVVIPEYISLKYSGFDAGISSFPPVLERYVNEYIALKFAPLDSVIHRVGRSIRNVRLQSWIWRRDSLWRRVYFWMESTSKLVRELNNEFIKPRSSARKNIKRLLDLDAMIYHDYLGLKLKTVSVHSGLNEIIEFLAANTEEPPFNSRLYKTFIRTFRDDYRECSLVSHDYRRNYRLRRQLEGPFAAALDVETIPFRIYRNISIYDRKQIMLKTLRPIYLLLRLDCPKPERGLPTRGMVYRESLRQFYTSLPKMEQTQPSQSQNLNIYWRQLDVRASFDLMYASSRVLYWDVKHLRHSLSEHYPAWSEMDKTKRAILRRNLTIWDARDNEIFGTYLSEYSTYLSINWLRLQHEDKLLALGEPDKFKERGLFTVRHPLSQSSKRFNRWLDEMGTITDEKLRIQKLSTIPRFTVLRQTRYLARLATRRVSGASVKSRSTGLSRLTVPTAGRRRRRRANRLLMSKRQVGSDVASSGTATTLETTGTTSQRRPMRSRNSWKSIRLRTQGRRSYSVQPLSSRINFSSPFVGQDDPRRLFGSSSCQSKFRAGDFDALDAINFDIPRTNGAWQAEYRVPRQQSDSISYLSPDETPTAGRFHLDLLKRPHGKRATIHYCRSLQSAEEVAQYFLKNKVIGFDMEWKAQASNNDTIQDNVSLIQVANEDQIALFQLALYRPARTVDDLMPPSLKRLLESPDITKVGVSIKADSTRLRRHLGVSARGLFELSHLYKLVKYYPSKPTLVNKRPVNLGDQVEDQLGLSLDKAEDVRCSDWTRVLGYRQIQCKFFAFAFEQGGVCEMKMKMTLT